MVTVEGAQFADGERRARRRQAGAHQRRRHHREALFLAIGFNDPDLKIGIAVERPDVRQAEGACGHHGVVDQCTGLTHFDPGLGLRDTVNRRPALAAALQGGFGHQLQAGDRYAREYRVADINLADLQGPGLVDKGGLAVGVQGLEVIAVVIGGK